MRHFFSSLPPCALSSQSPIGVYDSGVGGLMVLHKLRAALPHENFVYYGDTAHLPYGDKTPQQIHDYSQAILAFFATDVRAKLVVAACNTSSALALENLAPQVPFPVIGTILPLAERISALDPLPTSVAVLATPATAASRMHARALLTHGFHGPVYSIGCPAYVPLLESPVWDEAALHAATQIYLAPLLAAPTPPEAIIFGCTHYPLVAEILRAYLPASTRYIDPADAIVEEVVAELKDLNLLTSSSQRGTCVYYCSGVAESFAQKIATLFTLDVTPLHKNVHEAHP